MGKKRKPGKIQPTITEFLRTEAKTIYANLPPDLKAQTSKQKIFEKLKESWKDGDRVKREYRQIKSGEESKETQGVEEQGELEQNL
jgi:hypothetical protein